MEYTDTDKTIPAHPVVETKVNRGLALGTGSRRVLALAVVVGLVVLAFFAGRSYQNNIDQKLFNDYNPPTSSGTGLGARSGAGFSGAAGAGFGQSSQVRAALSAGSPPGTNSNAASSAGNSGGSGGSASQSNSAGGTSVFGSLASISSTRLSVQSFGGGTQSVPLTPQTRFYQTVSAATSALQPGEFVTIQASGGTSKPSAVSITIGSAAIAGGRLGGGGRFGGGGGFGGFGGTPTTRLSGTITRTGNGTISVSGVTAPVTVSSSTRISKTVSISPGKLQSGAFVTVRLANVSGRQVATTVVARNSAFRGSGGVGSGGFSGANG